MIRFIVDAHIPKKLADFLKWKGYDAIHTSELPNQNKTKDSEINKISVEEKRVLITKDLDFIESFFISNKPYKLIFLTCGNISNKELINIFKTNFETIIKMISENRMLEITLENIIVK